MVDRRSKPLKKVLQCIDRPYLVEVDNEVLIGFTRLPKLTLIEDRK